MKKTLTMLVVLLVLFTTTLPVSAAILPAENATDANANSTSAECTRNCQCGNQLETSEVLKLGNIITVIRNNYIIAQWYLCNNILYTYDGNEVCTVPDGTTINDIYVDEDLCIYTNQNNVFCQFKFAGWCKRLECNYDIVRYNINNKGYLTSITFTFGTIKIEKLF